MSAKLEISLAADGRVLLHLPRHTVALPMNEIGLDLLRHTLQEHNRGQTQLCAAGNPTQWNLTEALKSAMAKRKPASPSFDLSLIDLDNLI